MPLARFPRWTSILPNISYANWHLSSTCNAFSEKFCARFDNCSPCSKSYLTRKLPNQHYLTIEDVRFLYEHINLHRLDLFQVLQWNVFRPIQTFLALVKPRDINKNFKDINKISLMLKKTNLSIKGINFARVRKLIQRFFEFYNARRNLL